MLFEITALFIDEGKWGPKNEKEKIYEFFKDFEF